MKKTIKILMIFSLLGLGSLLNNSVNSTVLDIKEEIDDNLENSIKFVKNAAIGKDEVVAFSKVYVQHGFYEEEGKTVDCLRFATAVKGNLEKISFQRQHIEGLEDVAEKEVQTLYYGIQAENDIWYFDGENITTDENYAGHYYWATYTIRFLTDTYKNTDFSLDFFVNGEKKGTATANLYSFTKKINNESLKEKYGSPQQYALTSGKDMKFTSDVRGYYYEAEDGSLVNCQVENNLMLSGGKNIGWFNPNSSITFSIESQVEADVMIMASMASSNVSGDRLAKDVVNVKYGTTEESLQEIRNNECVLSLKGNWIEYTLNRLGEIHLEKGINIIKLIGVIGANYDYITLSNPFTGEEPEKPVDPIEEKYGTWTKAELTDGSGNVEVIKGGTGDAKVFDTTGRGYFYEAEKATALDTRINEKGTIDGSSGGYVLGGFEVGYYATFKIDSSVETDVLLTIQSATYAGSVTGDNLYSIEYGSSENSLIEMDISSTIFNFKNSYMTLVENKVGELHLEKGVNFIKITAKGRSSNIDYISLITPNK